MEMLEKSIKRYHNKVITAAEVMEELIDLSKDIQAKDKEPEQMGLSGPEYAFYCVRRRSIVNILMCRIRGLLRQALSAWDL